MWEKLGSMPLRSHGNSCLQHVIKLGAHTPVQRYLRITLHGLLHPPRDGTLHGAMTFFHQPPPAMKAHASIELVLKTFDFLVMVQGI